MPEKSRLRQALSRWADSGDQHQRDAGGESKKCIEAEQPLDGEGAMLGHEQVQDAAMGHDRAGVDRALKKDPALLTPRRLGASPWAGP